MINLSQDIPSFVSSFPHLPSDVDIVIARKEGSNNHHDFCVRRSKVLASLQWLVANNIYFNDITISYDQGRRKIFITGQAKLNYENMLIKCMGSR